MITLPKSYLFLAVPSLTSSYMRTPIRQCILSKVVVEIRNWSSSYVQGRSQAIYGSEGRGFKSLKASQVYPGSGRET